MYFSVKDVRALNDHTLIITFESGERKRFDMKPYLDLGVFKKLREPSVFNSAHVSFNTVAWDGDIDFDPEALYEGGLELKDDAEPLASNEY